jgi:hypothetical protein
MNNVLKGKAYGPFVIDAGRRVLYFHHAKCGASKGMIDALAVPVVRLGGKNPVVVEVMYLKAMLGLQRSNPNCTVRQQRLYSLYKEAYAMFQDASGQLTSDQIKSLVRSWESIDSPFFVSANDHDEVKRGSIPARLIQREPSDGPGLVARERP